MTSERTTARGTAWRTSLWTAGVGGATFLLLAIWLVPWSPVPGGMPAPVDAATVFTPAQLDRAEAYAGTARLLGWASLLVSLLVASLLGFTGLGARMLRRIRLPWWLAAAAGTLVVLLIGRLATLPISLALRDHVHTYGLSDQALTGYLYDVAVAFGLNVLLISVVMLILVGSARRWPRRWPVVAGAAGATLVVVTSFVYPLLVEPLFNDFEPMPASPLRSSILRIAAEEEVPVDDVLVADASRRTTTLNAYVSGLGDTRRVVVYDNLVDGLPEDQALSVVAHELAHARNDDVLLGTALGAAGAVFAVGLLGLLLGWSPLCRRARVSGPADVAVVPLVLALSLWGSLLANPAENTISRQIETRADVVALQTTQDGGAFTAMQRELALRNISDPTPPSWSQFWFGSHPTVLQRLATADQVLAN